MEFFGDEIDRISEFDALTGQVRSTLKHVMIFPASHYIVGHERLHDALQEITREMEERVKYFTETTSSSKLSVSNSAPATTWKCSEK